MPTKTERILGVLPGSFRALIERSALRAVAGAFGGELQAAENSLAALMRAHWVDHADRGAAEIDDLARLAALYGLAPREDEGVEEFRLHLKRYVRTFLAGTVTVEGVLRIAAEALGLRLADGPLDPWWRRQGDELVDVDERGRPRRRRFVTRALLADEAAATLFGFADRAAVGAAPSAARVVGRREHFSGSVDLTTARWLRLAVDGAAAVEIDCAGPRPRATLLAEAAAAINAALGATPERPVAVADGHRLALVSPTAGPASRLAFEPPQSGADARELLFGEVPAVARGEAASPAVLTGEVELLNAVDLSRRPTLRLAVDGGPPRDVRVAGADPARTFLDEVVAAVNAAVPGLAAAAGDRLRLTSPTAGEGSRLAVLPVRRLEVVEYPPEPVALHRPVRHGDRAVAVERGAGNAPFAVEVRAEAGALASGLASLAENWQVRALVAVGPDEVLRLGREEGGRVSGALVGPNGTERPLADGELLAGPLAPVGAGEPLILRRGRSELLYLECAGSRFDRAEFDAARFAGVPCVEPGIFDVSRFAPSAGPLAAVFAGPEDAAAPPAELALSWRSHRAGAFVVNLPADLPARFGGRFDAARFAGGEAEEYPAAVLDPGGDPRGLAARLTAESALVTAAPVPRVPLGFTAARVPFRRPRRLTLGDDATPARLYLTEAGVDEILELRARDAGEWGDEIEVTARPGGAAAWDVTVEYRGARFENARQAVRGRTLPAAAGDLLAPGPVGILEAKAAGVAARVTRDGAELTLTVST